MKLPAKGNRLIKSICRLVWLAYSVFALTKLWAEQLQLLMSLLQLLLLQLLLLLLTLVSSVGISRSLHCAYSFEMQLDFYVNWATVGRWRHWRPPTLASCQSGGGRGWAAAATAVTSHLSMHLTYFPRRLGECKIVYNFGICIQIAWGKSFQKSERITNDKSKEKELQQQQVLAGSEHRERH